MFKDGGGPKSVVVDEGYCDNLSLVGPAIHIPVCIVRSVSALGTDFDICPFKICSFG